MKRYDPLFGNNKTNKRDLVTQASSDTQVTAGGTPLSPFSGKPMIKVQGCNEGKKFDMWVNIADRIALPCHD